MQISKKLYTSLVITILALSTIVAAVPMVSAISATPPELRVAANPPGALVTSSNVNGRVTVVGVDGGAGDALPFSTVTLYWDGLAGKVLGTVDADVTGAWAINVTIPSAIEGTHYIVATDGSGNVGAPIDVTTSLTVGPPGPTARALPGDEVVITGHGYAANSAVTVTLDSTTLGVPNSVTLTTPTITTNATGSFTATIVVPTTITVAQYDTYDVTAEDASANSGVDQLIIDYYILLMPGSGPTGITTTVYGRIPINTAYELRFNGAQIATGTSAADGTFTFAYTIPGVLSPAFYDVDVVWATVNIKTIQFQVTSSPTITTGGVTHAVAGTTVPLTGGGFSGLANITLRFDSTVVNSTAADDRFGPTTFIGGNIPSGTNFVVPTLTAGVYAVSVVDQYGATSATGVFFTIDPTPVFEAYTRATAYVQGNVISIYTYSTTNPAVYMVIADPNGMFLWAGANPAWVDMGAYYSIPASSYAPQTVTLPSDAPVGTWNFTVYEDATMATILDTNLFSVSAPATLDTVMDEIDDVKDTLDDMSDMISSIDGDVATIQGDVDSVQSIVSGLDISVLSSDIDSIKVAVADLEAVVTAVAGDVATVDTTLGTLQGTITSINGNVATIETDVGTLQADISDIKANVDNTPAWIAVVLALVAAVAAIFAVITIRQKIAG